MQCSREAVTVDGSEQGLSSEKNLEKEGEGGGRKAKVGVPCVWQQTSQTSGAGFKVHHALYRTHPYVLVPSSVQMARGGEEYGETGCKLLIRSATAPDAVLCTEAPRAATYCVDRCYGVRSRPRTCAPCLLYVL